MTDLLARSPRGQGIRLTGMPSGWLAAGAVAAVTVAGLVGTTTAVVVVQTLDPGGGLPLGGSGALAGRLWLLAHGAELEPASGPLRLAPLLLTLAIACGLTRAARWAVPADGASDGRVVASVGVAVAVHVLLTTLLAVVLDQPGAGVQVVRAGAGAALLAALAVGWGAGRETGLENVLPDRLVAAAEPLLRGVLAGFLALVALCTAVVALALAYDASGYAALSRSLGGAAAGAVGLLALGVLLLPNAAGAVLGLAAGPGFSVGAGTVVSVDGVTLGAVPALPLLAALPDTQAVPLLAFAAQAVPVLGGLVAGVVLGRHLSEGDGGSLVAALLGAVGGVLLGLASAAFVWLAGGSLGDGNLAQVGAPVVATGLAVAAQSAGAAALAAAVVRWRTAG